MISNHHPRIYQWERLQRSCPHLGARLAEVLDLHHVVGREVLGGLFAHLLHLASYHNCPKCGSNKGKSEHAQRLGAAD